ncbi:MAG TPA: UDPGP type 1 family protein [Planctomycetaceae bacterium]|nr:UDPGP type 1 family protein [Planctomycetaceae bacterium]
MSERPPQTLVHTLDRAGQSHILRWWDELSGPERSALVAQIDAIDFNEIRRLWLAARAGNESAAADTPAERARRAQPPADLVRLPETLRDRELWSAAARRGEELLRSGRVGVILVAGGQGTRLGFPHPKGMYPIGPISGCSLYQLLAEQLLARSRRAGVAIPCYVMTSDATHDETVEFFEQQRFFGLDATDVRFFRQGNMPAVDAGSGRLLLAGRSQLATSPDGHGGLLQALKRSGMFADMRARGVEQLYYHQVDNPTVKVCDPAFLGWHVERRADVSTKVVAKRSWDERMGVAVSVDGVAQIIEYSDLPDDVAQQTESDGRLRHWAGSTAVHVFDREFLERLASSQPGLPFHIARKKVPHLDENGEHVEPAEPNASKFERFVFDTLPQARTALAVETDRAREFNPVKNADGADSPATARAALCAIHAGWLRSAGQAVPAGATVEIGPLFALDAEDVQERFRAGHVFDGRVYLG